eukprot:371038-Pyramimonas_sp.AAC.1
MRREGNLEIACVNFAFFAKRSPQIGTHMHCAPPAPPGYAFPVLLVASRFSRNLSQLLRDPRGTAQLFCSTPRAYECEYKYCK